MIRFLGRALFALVLWTLVAGTMFYGALQWNNQSEKEFATRVQAGVTTRLENKNQIMFSPQDCRQAMNKAENAQQDAYSKALRICRHVAAWGDIDTQFDLGILYEEGKHVAKDPEESERWFDAAARQGHVVALYKTVVIHSARAYEEEKLRRGRGLLDFMDAYGWLCVLEKQLTSPEVPGLEIWNASQTKYDEKLQKLRQIYADDMNDWPWPVHWAAKNRCQDYVKIFDKGSAP